MRWDVLRPAVPVSGTKVAGPSACGAISVSRALATTSNCTVSEVGPTGMNGHGLPIDIEIYRDPRDWNLHYFAPLAALVTGRAVRRAELERAILLVGDLPGVTVRESKYIRQDGFGILLVTITNDRLSAYAQIDNRGSKEVGPIRSTIIANARGIFQPGDEASVIFANTPIDPTEFGFVRGRYSAAIDTDGTVPSASASYARAQPGASLKPLDVIGESIDASVFYAKPILRDRRRSLWAGVEFRGLRSSQTLLGSPLRSDHFATLTASVNGTMQLRIGLVGRSAIRARMRFFCIRERQLTTSYRRPAPDHMRVMPESRMAAIQGEKAAPPPPQSLIRGASPAPRARLIQLVA